MDIPPHLPQTLLIPGPHVRANSTELEFLQRWMIVQDDLLALHRALSQLFPLQLVWFRHLQPH